MEIGKIEISISIDREALKSFLSSLTTLVSSAEDRVATPVATNEETANTAPALAISDSEVAEVTRATVNRLKEAGVSPVAIREKIFVKYGISRSIDCPQERRAEMLDDLNNLNR